MDSNARLAESGKQARADALFSYQKEKKNLGAGYYVEVSRRPAFWDEEE